MTVLSKVALQRHRFANPQSPISDNLFMHPKRVHATPRFRVNRADTFRNTCLPGLTDHSQSERRSLQTRQASELQRRSGDQQRALAELDAVAQAQLRDLAAQSEAAIAQAQRKLQEATGQANQLLQFVKVSVRSGPMTLTKGKNVNDRKLAQ